MPIHGSLDEAPVADVVQLLSLGQKTGCLSLTDGTLRGEIYLDGGRVSQATVFNRRDRLGDLLVRSGKITRQQLEEAIAEHRASGVRRVSKILVESGQVARRELEQFVRVGVEEAVYFMFSWRSGSFTFTSNVRPESKDFLVSIDPQELLLEGARRVDEWSLIKKKIPRFDMVFRVDRARLNGASVNLTDEQKRIVPLVDGSRDCTAIVETTGMSEFEVGKALFGLITAGFAFLVERRAAQRHLDYQELLAYVVKEARFADAEQRKAAARHIADCATCTARLKSIHVRRTGSTAALPAIETEAEPAPTVTAVKTAAKQPPRPTTPPTSKAAELAHPAAPRASTTVVTTPVSPPVDVEAGSTPALQENEEWPDVERRVNADRRAQERRSGGERRRAVTRDWASGGRVERRTGRDRRHESRRDHERRAWVPVGGGASAPATAATAHAVPRRSYPDRRTTGPRRVPIPDRRAPANAQPQRVITRDRPAAKPVADHPAEERPAQEAASAPAAPPPAEELVTHDLATEHQLLSQEIAAPSVPPALAEPEPGTERAEQAAAAASPTEVTPEPVVERAPEAATSSDTDAATTAPAESVDDAALESDEVEAESEQKEKKPPAKSREFSWLVSPDEADHLVRTSWVELQTPRRSGRRRSDRAAARAHPPAPSEAQPRERREVQPGEDREAQPRERSEAQPRERIEALAPPVVRSPAVAPAREPVAAQQVQAKSPASEVQPRSSKVVRWIASVAAAIVLMGAGMLVRPLLQRQPTTVPEPVASVAQQPPVQQAPAQAEPSTTTPDRTSQSAAPPSSEATQPAAPISKPATRAAPPPARSEPPPTRVAPRVTPAETPPAAATRETPPVQVAHDSGVAARPTPQPPPVSPPAEPKPAATTTIRGSVRAAGTGVPVAGAVVAIAGKGLTATTDQTGSYSIADVPVGAATLEVTLSGKPAGQREITTAAGTEATADFSVAAMVTAAKPDDDLASGEWETASATDVAEQLGGFIAVVPGLWLEGVASPTAGSRRRARVAQLTAGGDRIVLTETRSGAPGLGAGTPKVTALRVIGPTEAYPVTTGTASFGSLLVTAKTTLAPDSLRALLAKLTPLVPSP